MHYVSHVVSKTFRRHFLESLRYTRRWAGRRGRKWKFSFWEVSRAVAKGLLKTVYLAASDFGSFCSSKWGILFEGTLKKKQYCVCEASVSHNLLVGILNA